MFEPARDEPNRFRVYRLNRSAKDASYVSRKKVSINLVITIGMASAMALGVAGAGEWEKVACLPSFDALGV